MDQHVLLCTPNIIGYFRILLIFTSWGAFNNPSFFVPAYVISVILDGVDGFVARRLKQTSKFGAWLDVVVDNLGRAMLWGMLYDWGWLVSSVEWCVYVCNHNSRGDQWKSSFTESPVWVSAIMANDFKTPRGVLAIAGLHGLPVWLYGYQRGILNQLLCVPDWLQTLGLLGLIAGRLLCLSVELWCVITHVRYLTASEAPAVRD